MQLTRARCLVISNAVHIAAVVAFDFDHREVATRRRFDLFVSAPTEY